MTQSYINELSKAIESRTDRMNSLIKIIDDIRSNYKAMSINQLNEAIRDVVGMRKEITEHRDFLAKAKKERDSFYANPTKVA